MPKTTVSLDTRALDAMLKSLDGNITDAVAKAAFMVEARAKMKAPVDTGALRASIYVSMARGGKGDEAMAAAKARNPDANTAVLPKPRDAHTAFVGPSVEYAQVVELGGHNRSGTPFMQPAVRETEAEFRALLAGAVSNGK